MSDCLFCEIVAHRVPASFVTEEEHAVAIRDINPQAPTHVLVMPREHITSADALTPEHDELWAALLRLVQRIARDEDIAGRGYRVVANVGTMGGQTVAHLHLHVLGGRQMTWPPG
ncbi:MAG: histidine triad nucleotide-binding protein [Candidatus Dormibacteraeota bacterium]|nr:histidine triad nucleotide-binding protein [Candidatus Dormibacteraeota bacterium]